MKTLINRHKMRVIGVLLLVAGCTYEVQHSWEGDPPTIRVVGDIDLDVVHTVTGDIAVDAAHNVEARALTVVLQ